jgi:hypothetical protein
MGLSNITLFITDVGKLSLAFQRRRRDIVKPRTQVLGQQRNRNCEPRRGATASTGTGGPGTTIQAEHAKSPQ